MAEALGVWLSGTMVAVISRKRRQLRLAYTEEALRQYPLGLPLLSIALPLTRVPYTHLPVRAFLDGLLPEGQPRQEIARDIGVRQDDTFGLIEALGRDCAGAIVILPANEPQPSVATTHTARRLTQTEIAELVANLPEAPLGVSGRVRISLAGVQEKLLLTRMPDGSWGQPVDGTPSTHILKPEIARYPGTVENEAFCMRVAKHLGLAVANVETTEVGGRKLIVVERFDRVIAEDGSVERLHQEDFCQATAALQDQKYEEDGGPSLRKIAGILQTAASPDSTEALLRAVTLNLLLGNGDAHAKNFSILYAPTGAIRFAPLYDLMSTLFYGDERLAMFIDNVHRTNLVTAGRLTQRGSELGLPPPSRDGSGRGHIGARTRCRHCSSRGDGRLTAGNPSPRRIAATAASQQSWLKLKTRD